VQRSRQSPAIGNQASGKDKENYGQTDPRIQYTMKFSLTMLIWSTVYTPFFATACGWLLNASLMKISFRLGGETLIN